MLLNFDDSSMMEDDNNRVVVLIYGNALTDQQVIETMRKYNKDIELIVFGKDILDQYINFLLTYIQGMSKEKSSSSAELESKIKDFISLDNIKLSDLCGNYYEVVKFIGSLMDPFLSVNYCVIVESENANDIWIGYLLKHMFSYSIPTYVVQNGKKTFKSYLECIPFACVEKVFNDLDSCLDYIKDNESKKENIINL